MIDFSQLTFKKLVFHQVGNKARNEGINKASDYYSLQDEVLRDILLDYFLNPFKVDEFFSFTHDIQLKDNVLFQSCSAIFKDKNTLLEESIRMVEHLYAVSNHPKIKAGDLFIAYFSDCLIDDELVDAIGIFKAENKQLFLQTNSQVSYQQGINIKKLDKGCLVFNTNAEDGFRLLMIDKSSRSNLEAEFWRNDFLKLARVHDNSYNTQNYLHLCQAFCEDTYGEEGDSKSQVLFLNKSINYFSEHEDFDIEEFATNVIEEPRKINDFKTFKQNFEQESGLISRNDFKISQPAVKTMKRKFKSLIKLDTNIDIKISQNEPPEVVENHIEKGFDQTRNMFFYKVFFNEEV